MRGKLWTPCSVCGGAVKADRLKRYPAAKTCGRECADAWRRERKRHRPPSDRSVRYHQAWAAGHLFPADAPVAIMVGNEIWFADPAAI